MGGKAPPPTGAVDPRPKESSLGEKGSKQAHTFTIWTADADEERMF